MTIIVAYLAIGVVWTGFIWGRWEYRRRHQNRYSGITLQIILDREKRNYQVPGVLGVALIFSLTYWPISMYGSLKARHLMRRDT
ncbi:hypothetical protein [Catenuloplanes japonicus]|uniref:hypothetical protein n=1 Tax=Catenuloplanes japonicus TaxID=33876 RepID=UPI000527D571|nr:hypothetical protein [Catenuloplanes japonicus]